MGQRPRDAGDEDVSDDKVLRTLARYFLQDLVEIFYPDLAPDIDFQKSEVLNGKLFARFRKKGHVRPDVAVKLWTRDRDPRFGVFHAELEGRFTRAMEKRLKLYFHQIALEYDDPPVIAAVLFKKGGGPKAVERREVVRRMKSWVSNRFYYLAVSLSKCLAENYVTLPQSLAPALAALMSSEIWDRVEQKVKCLEAVSRTQLDDERRYLLTNVIDIYLDLDEEEEMRFRQELDKGDRKEVKKMVLTFQEAIADGEARGKVTEARKAVLRVAEHRWGSPPDDFVSKLEAVDDLDRLHGIMEQALKVSSLDEIGLTTVS